MELSNNKDAKVFQLRPRLFVATLKMEQVDNLSMNVKSVSNQQRSNYTLDQNADGLQKYAKKKKNA